MDLPGTCVVSQKHLGIFFADRDQGWLKRGASAGNPGFPVGQPAIAFTEPEQLGKLPNELLIDRDAPSATRPCHGPVADEFGEIKEGAERQSFHT